MKSSHCISSHLVTPGAILVGLVGGLSGCNFRSNQWDDESTPGHLPHLESPAADSPKVKAKNAIAT